MEKMIERTRLGTADAAAGFIGDPLEVLNHIGQREPRTVLVVDDEPLVLMAVVDFLISDGFAVLEADNADGALVMLETNPGIAAIFTDVQMPGSMNGLELARLVHMRWPDIKVVLTSGNAGFGAGDLAQGDRFIRKPYQVDAVARALLPH